MPKNCFTIHCEHKYTNKNDIFIEGTLKGKKSMHTLSSILPNLPIDHPCASLCTSFAVLYQDNHVFTVTVNTAVNAIKISWRNQLLCDTINKQHQVLSFIDHDNPDNESLLHCIRNLPLLAKATIIAVDSCIHTLRTNTEHFLWHQRLGQPSDSCLYNAHKYIDSVPKLKHSDSVIDYCPVCLYSI